MPAVVSRTDGSCSAGTSDPDGSRLWSRLSKKLRKRSRISSEVIAPESRLRAMRVVSTRVVYENRWMRVHEDRRRADGRRLYGWVEKPPSALIVPIDDGHVWLIEQFRHPVGQRFWEFPQGAWEDGRRRPRRSWPAASWPRRPACGRRRWSTSAACTSPTG